MISAILSNESRSTTAGEYVLAPDVLLLFVQDGTARLLDLGGHFHALSAVGATMLRAALDNGTAAAARLVAAQFSTEACRVEVDLHSLLQDLHMRGLIRRRQDAAPRRPGVRLAFVLLVPFLLTIRLAMPSLASQTRGLLFLARCSFHLLGWSRTLDVWRWFFRLNSSPRTLAQRAETLQTVDEVVRASAAEHLFTMECKERALCCWALLRSFGVPAELVIGINLFPLEGHCWCEAEARTWSDYPDRCATFIPVIRYT